jgi:hypothetical protein
LSVLALLLSFILIPFAIILGLLRKGKTAKQLAAISAGSLAVAVALIIISPTAPVKIEPIVKPPSLALKRNLASKDVFPQYLDLHRDQRVILDSNNEGDGRSATLFNDLETSRKWALGNFSGPEDLPHRDLPTGTVARVLSWTRIPSVTGDAKTMIQVATLQGRATSGYVEGIGVLPEIPRGTVLIVASNTQMSRTQLNASQTDSVPKGTRVKLLAIHPENSSVLPYQVSVLGGPKKGAVGWLSWLDLAAPSASIASDQYKGDCHCVTLYMLDRHANEHPTDADRTPSPDEGSITADDTSYMNEACNLMYPQGSGYGYDFGARENDRADMRVVTCAGPAADQLVYFRHDHLAQSKEALTSNDKAPGVPDGYPVPPPGSTDATPFPNSR